MEASFHAKKISQTSCLFKIWSQTSRFRWDLLVQDRKFMRGEAASHSSSPSKSHMSKGKLIQNEELKILSPPPQLIWPNGIIFHQPRYLWNSRGFPFQKATFWGENSCEVAIIWAEIVQPPFFLNGGGGVEKRVPFSPDWPPPDGCKPVTLCTALPRVFWSCRKTQKLGDGNQKTTSRWFKQRDPNLPTFIHYLEVTRLWLHLWVRVTLQVFTIPKKGHKNRRIARLSWLCWVVGES